MNPHRLAKFFAIALFAALVMNLAFMVGQLSQPHPTIREVCQQYICVEKP